MQLSTDSTLIWNLLTPVVEYLNSFLSQFVPGTEVIFLFVASLVIGYYIRNRNNWDRIGWIAFSLTLFAALRYVGVGG